MEDYIGITKIVKILTTNVLNQHQNHQKGFLDEMFDLNKICLK